MVKRTVLLVLVLGVLVSNSVNAALIYASSASSVTVGSGQGTANNRHMIENLYGASDGNFYELGLNGSVDLQFGTPTGQLFTGNGFITEVTFGSASAYLESADIYVGYQGNFEFVASVLNTTAQSTAGFTISGIWDTLRIKDTTSGLTTKSLGGFDIDSVAVSLVTSSAEVSAPASLGFLISALTLMFVRKRFLK